jgi:hypothetical protein
MSEGQPATPESHLFRLNRARGDFTNLLISDEMRERLLRERKQARSRARLAGPPPRKRALPVWMQLGFAILIAASLWLFAFAVIYISVPR